jgi:hypothetical protein
VKFRATVTNMARVQSFLFILLKFNVEVIPVLNLLSTTPKGSVGIAPPF